MKKAELKNRIRQAADATPVPECAERVLCSVQNNAVPTPVVETSQPRQKAKPSRRIWVPAFTVALAACLVLVLMPWSQLFAPQGEPLAVGKAQQVMSRELIALAGTVAEVEPQRVLAGGATNPSQEDCNKIARSVNDYLFAGDAFCDKDSIVTCYEKNKDASFADWDYKLTVTYRDGSAFAESYCAYFDEIQKSPSETSVRGVLVVGGVVYSFDGEREVEHDEVEMEMRLVTGEDSYVVVSNETEVNENEYEYAYYKGGRLTRGVEMEVSVEGGVKKAELEITEDNQTWEYECVYLANGANLRCYDEREDLLAKATVTADGAYYVYTFEGGNVVRLLK